MSNIRISRPAAQNPTGLTPVAGYNRPATNTIGDFAQKQGITFESGAAQIGQLEEKIAKNRELAHKFRGTRYEKVYQQAADRFEQQLAQLKGTKPEAQVLREQTAALQKDYEAAQAAKKAQEVKQAWEQYENAPKEGQKTYNSIFEYRKAEIEAQEAAQRGFPIKNRAVASTTPQPTVIPQGNGAQEAGSKIKDAVAEKLKQKPTVSAETIDAGLGIGKAPKSAQESAGVFIKRGVEDALSKPTTISAEAIDASLGIGKASKSAQGSMGVFIKRGIEDATKDAGKISPEIIDAGLGIGQVGKSAEESARVFMENGFGPITQQKGFFSKLGGWLKDKGKAIGNFVKNNKGKLAIAAAVIALGALALSKCTGDKDKTPVTTTPVSADPVQPADEPTEPTPVAAAEPTPVATAEPTEPTPAVPVDPAEPGDKKDEPVVPIPDVPVDPTEPDDNVAQDKPIHKDDAPEPNYTLKAKYCGMYQYVSAAYGVEQGSTKHKQIMEKLWEANPGLRNRTLYIGDKVFLPEVEIDGEVIKPDLDKQPADLPKPEKSQPLDRYEGYKGQERYGVGETHDDNANQYHDTDKKKVQDKANEAA